MRQPYCGISVARSSPHAKPTCVKSSRLSIATTTRSRSAACSTQVFILTPSQNSHRHIIRLTYVSPPEFPFPTAARVRCLQRNASFYGNSFSHLAPAHQAHARNSYTIPLCHRYQKPLPTTQCISLAAPCRNLPISKDLLPCSAMRLI